MKKTNNERMCGNYFKICPIANKCDNCKSRIMRSVRGQNGEIKFSIHCKKKNDVNGDHSKCFECRAEGYRCKAD